MTKQLAAYLAGIALLASAILAAPLTGHTTPVQSTTQPPQSTAPTTPAPPDPALETFRVHCAGCHGERMQGGRAESLIDDKWMFGGDDRSLVRTILEGRQEAGMPAFKGTLSDAQAREIVFMIRFARSRELGPPASRATPTIDGVTASELHEFRIEVLTDAVETPWALAFLPDGRLLVTERPGRLRVIENGHLKPDPIAGIPAVWKQQDGGLFDVEVHPRFADNGWIYLSYAEQKGADRSMTAIVRGRLKGNELVEQVSIARWPDALYTTANVHYGSRFTFDRSGNLYYSIGDRGQAPSAQDLSAPSGKIHRVTDDGRPVSSNPFTNRSGALPTIWSFGHRNPQGLAWHPRSGELWETEHGPRGGDEVNVIKRGANYGWPVVTFGILDAFVSPELNRKATTTTARDGMEPPVTYYNPSPGLAPIAFYTGDAFPRWKDDLLMGAMRDEELKRLSIEGHRIRREEVLLRGLGRVRDIVQGPDGFVYLALANPGPVVSDTTSGRIVRLVPTR